MLFDLIKPQFADWFTWRNFNNQHIMEHHDGSASILIPWNGIDGYLRTPNELNSEWDNIRAMLRRFDTDTRLEGHLFREHDFSLAKDYYEQHRFFVRAKEVGTRLRGEIADHLAAYALSNKTYIVLHRSHSKASKRVGKHFKLLDKLSGELLEIAQDVSRNLPGGRLGERSEYLSVILQSLYRSQFKRGISIPNNDDFYINELAVNEKPQLTNGCILVDDIYTKSILLNLPPDAIPAFSKPFCSFPIEMHIAHIIQPLDTDKVVRASEQETFNTQSAASEKGQERTNTKLSDQIGFRRYIRDNSTGAFNNAYVIQLHGTYDEVTTYSRRIEDLVSEYEGRAVKDADIQFSFWRACAPGQGYLTPWARPDEGEQVACMFPAQRTHSGTSNPQMLRMTQDFQLVGLSYGEEDVNHSITAAMTGAGKGVNKCAQIAETYPFGIDWYSMEVGTSYEWTVQAFGGTYLRIDPDEAVINPLPAYSMAKPDEHGIPQLDLSVTTGTVEGITLLLSDKPEGLDRFERAAAQAAMAMLYVTPPPDKKQPLFEDLLIELQNPDWAENEKIAEASKNLADNLEAFLVQKEGQIFNNPNNIHLEGNIIGADLLLVKNKAKRLMPFYLTFLGLTFAQRAFALRRPSRVLLDEMHEFVAETPHVMKHLVSGIARMGRKDAAALDLVSQETEEMDAIERAVINQCPWHTFLYRGADHDYIAHRTDMPAGVLETWKAYKNPLKQPYRPAIQKVGDNYYDLFLTFPENMLTIASSSPNDLDDKAIIGKKTKDVFERVSLLREAQHRRKQAKQQETV